MSITTLDTVTVRRWKRYPEYRPSQTELNCAMPVHWSVHKVKHIASGRPGSFIDGDWIESPYIRDEGVRLIQCGNVGTGAYEEQGFRYISEHTFREFRCTEVTPGDVLICRLRSSPRILAGRACLAPDLGCKMITSVDNCILKPAKQFDARYLVYQMSDVAYLGYIEAIARGGTRDRISRSMLADFKLLTPPLPEQRAIAAFLDRETARIDALIGHKERLIALLEEKRQAVISHAVTRGLDPAAPLKDSDTPWLGMVPEHWRMTRLKFVADVQSGITLGKNYGDRELVERPYLRVANVQDGFLDLEEITTIQLPVADVCRHELRAGDVLMTEGGDFDKLGRGYVWEGQIPGCLHQNHVFAVRPNLNCLQPHFLSSMMTSAHGRTYFTFTSQQSTNLASTNATKLGNFPIPLPNLHEQNSILTEIQNQSRAFSQTLDRIRVGIARLQEYRTALISAAVTGQIDVRGEVIP